MLRKVGLALALLVFGSAAFAQTGQLAPGQIFGNATSSQAPPAPTNVAAVLAQWGTALPGTVGGTNNAFMQFSGPATSLKTYTLPNVSGTLGMLSQVQTWTGQQTFVAPILGAATGTSLALTSASSTALAVGLNGTTNPAFQVDDSASSQVAGVKISGAATGGTVGIAAVDSGANTNLTLDAKGGGQVTIGGSSGSVKLASASNIISGAITYGGVALNNAVTGTGNMALSAGPTFTGTAAFAALSATGQFTSTLATGTAPFSVASQTNVANLNASFLNGGTFAAPGPIGSGTAGTGTFTTLSASTVTGAGFTTYLSAPPAIGGATPNAGSFSTLSATTGGTLAGTFAGSPSFSGSPTAVTQSAGDNSTKLATTAYVNSAVPNGSSTWTPTASNLTVVNGTGAATITGKYTKTANIVYWTITVTVSGTATTASTANSTSFSLPTTPVGFGVGAAVDANVVSFGEGISSGGSSVFFAPTWSARNTNITISGWYFTS